MAHWKTQSVLIPKSWTKVEAERWIKAHGYKITFYGKKAHITEKYRRYRQRSPKKGKGIKVRTLRLPNGVKLVEYVKS
jgi:hypothetical protein